MSTLFSLGNYLLTIYFLFTDLIFPFFLSSASVILSFLYVLTSKSLMNILVICAGCHYKEWTQKLWMKLGCQWRAEKQRKIHACWWTDCYAFGNWTVVGSGFALQARTPMIHFPMVISHYFRIELGGKCLSVLCWPDNILAFEGQTTLLLSFLLPVNLRCFFFFISIVFFCLWLNQCCCEKVSSFWNIFGS